MSIKLKLTDILAKLLWNNWRLFLWAKIALIVFTFLAGATLLLIFTLPGKTSYVIGTVIGRGYISTEFGSKVILDIRTETIGVLAVRLSKNDPVPENDQAVCIRISERFLVGGKVASFALPDLCGIAR